MARLHATPPLTPLDALRTLLLGFNEGQTSFASDLGHSVQRLRRSALKVLRAYLLDPVRPRGLKRAILSLPARFDWPDWVPILEELLNREPDLGLFDEGSAALGSLGIRSAREALQRLSESRTEPDRQTVLQRELSLFTPQQPLAHYLGRLQEGQSNVRLANQGAKFLSVMVGPENLGTLMETLAAGDPLTQRLTLKVMGSIPHPEAPRALLRHLELLRREREDRQTLLALIHRIAALPRTRIREEFCTLLEERFGARDALAMSRLKGAIGTDEPSLGTLLEPLRIHVSGTYEGFLVEAMALLLESKVARFGAYHAEVEEASTSRLSQIQEQAESIGEILAYLVSDQQIPLEDVVPALKAAFQSRLGQDGLLQAYLQLVPVNDEGAFTELLQEPEPHLREKYLDALGGREEDALTEFFLRAMQDPIVEVGQRAIHHLGRLPGSFRALMAMFESGQLEQVRRAIRVFGENRIRMAAEPLVEFLRQDSPDDLLVEAVDALANMRHQGAAPVLLDLLHDGKPLTLQASLTRALTELETPEASLGLLARAPHLKQASVLIQTLEGTLAAFADYQHPLPSAELPAFLALLERCCDAREGEGQQVRAILACEGLYIFDRDAYLKLKDRFSDVLSDLRLKENWDREMNERISALVKEMGRRAEQLGHLSKREAELRHRMTQLPPSGAGRVDELLALREGLNSPDLILRPEMAREVADFVLKGLGQSQSEWREIAHLCEIGGISGCRDLADPIRAIYQRASGLGLRSASQKALQQLGLSAADIERRRTVRTILVLEPSAFFRRRIILALQQDTSWTVREAGSRSEAEAQLAEQAVDALVTEHQDAAGDLQPWVDSRWQKGQCDRVLLSTADRGAGASWQGPMMAGALFKPYPPEQLIDMLKS